MTSPVSVGAVSVEVLADARRLAKSLRSEIENAFKGLDLDKAIRDSVGGKPVRVKVETDVDANDIPEKIRRQRVPKVPVEVDPVMQAFQAEVKRQSAALARQAIRIPVDADGGRLRAQVGAEIAAVQARLKVQIPTEPGSKAAYEAKLRAQLEEVSRRVKQNVKLDVDRDRLSSAIGSAFKGLGTVLPNIGGLSSALADVGGALQKAAGSSAQLGGNLIGAFSAAAGPIGAVVAFLGTAAAAMVSLGSAAVVAAGAVSAVAGAAASIPGAIAGGVAAFGTLKLGFSGVGDAISAIFKPKAGGGGGGGGGAGEDPADRARRIAGAERGVESARRGIASATRGVEAAERGYDDAVRRVSDAQRHAQQAQEAVNRARREAKEDIEDLNRALSGAKLDEEDAALRVTEALRALNAAKETGVLPDIQRADLEYRQAQQALEEAKDSTQDLGEASAEANKQGVEGSDKVQSALEDQRQALQGVKDAQAGVLDAQNAVLAANDGLKSSYDSLASAQDSLVQAQKKAASGGGGGGGLASQLPKLAPAAQAFVDAIKRLKPAFDDLRLDVQQRLFAGLDTVILSLASKWKAPLGRIFGSYADTFNGFFKDLGASLGQPQFITDIETGAEGFRKGLDKILDAVSGPLVEAFGTLSAASAPFLEALGDEIADVVTKFSEWVQAGKDSGALQDFFTAATEAMHTIFDIGGSVVSIIGSIITIITGRRNVGTGKSALESFAEGLQKVADWLDDPAHQEGIRQFFEDVVDGFRQVGKVVDAISGWIDKFNEIKAALFGTDDANESSSIGETIGKALIAGIATGVQTGFETTWGIIAGVLWSGPNSLIGRVKSLLGIASPSTVMAEIGGFLMEGLAQGVLGGLAGLLRAAAQIPEQIVAGVGNTARLLYGAGRNAIAGLINGAVSLASTLSNRIAALRTSISNTFSRAATLLYSAGRNVTAGLVNGAVSLAGTLSQRVGQLRATITNWFANAGSLLYSTGRNVVIGLYNGIASLGSWLSRQVRSFVNAYVPQVIQSALGINSPSKVAAALGRRVPEGLALGIESGARDVQAAADKLAALAVPGVDIPGLGADLDAAVAGNLAIAGSHTFVLDFAPGFTGDFLVDGLKRNIQARNNGNVQAALGS